jgi:hypothetical protein
MTDTQSKQAFYRRLFWISVISITLFRLVIAGLFGLSTDESHYVLYSQNLAWGYFDHPPMVGFLGALTSLLGHSSFFVRLGPVLCWLGSIMLLRLLILELYKDEKIALVAAVFILLMPVQHLLAISLLPDATLNMFWCATLLFAWRAMKSGRWLTWCMTGVFLGCAFLSKYHGVLLPMCIVLYVVTSRETRKWMLSPKPYVAVVIGLLVFLPNIIWNYRNNWISYAFQLGHGGGSGKLEIGKVFESIGGQMGAVTPILFVLLVIAFIHIARSRPLNSSDRFVLWTSMPVFVFFCGIGLTGKVLPHWPAVGLWTGSAALAVMFLRKTNAENKFALTWKRWFATGAILAFIAILFTYIAIAFPVIEGMYNGARNISITLNRRIPSIKPLEPFKPKIDITNDLYGWDKAGEAINEIRFSMPRPEKTFVFCHKFFTTSQLLPYLSDGTVGTTLSRKPSQYLLWFDPAEHKGWDAIFVDIERWKKGIERYAGLFEKVEVEPVTLETFRSDNHLAHRFFLYKCYGFKGKKEGE